jgi:hypothetical protein
MANIESKIVVNIRAIVEGTEKVKDLSNATVGLNGAINKAGDGTSKLNGKFNQVEPTTKAFANAIANTSKALIGEETHLSKVSAALTTYIAKQKQAEAAERGRAAVKQSGLNEAGTLAEFKRADPFQLQGESIAATRKALAAQDTTGQGADAHIRALENERAALRKLNDEAVRSGKDGTANINSLLNRFNQLDQTRKFTNLLSDLKGVGTGLTKMERLTRLATIAFSPLAAAGRFVAGIFSQITAQIEFAAAAAVLFIASLPFLAFSFLIKEGTEFNNVMEQQRIGLAALIQSTENLFNKDNPNKPLEGVEAYRAATTLAEESTQRLFTKLIPLRATSEELLPVFNQIVSAAAAANLKLEETENTFVTLAAAAQVLQVPIERLGTDIRLLLSGAVRATSRLGTGIFGSAKEANEFIKVHKEAGDLYDALQKKLIAYKLALLDSTESFSVLGHNTLEVFQRLSGLATSTLFTNIKQGLINITKAFFDLDTGKVQPRFEALFAFINAKLGEVGEYITRLTDKIIGYITDIADYVQKNQSYVNSILNDLVGIGSQLGGILIDLGSILGDVDQARAKTGSWHTLLLFIRGTLASTRDVFSFIIGLLQYVVGGLLGDVTGTLNVILAIVEKIGGVFSSSIGRFVGDLRELILDVQNGALDLANTGRSRLGRGLPNTDAEVAKQRFEDYDEQGRYNPVGTFSRFLPASQRNKLKASQFTSTLKPGGPDSDSAKKEEQLQNRLGELNKRTSELLRQLLDSQNEIERAGLEKEYALVKDAAERTQKEIDRNYATRLISIKEYYTEKQQVDDYNIALDKKNLTDQFEKDKKDAQNKLDALSDKYNGVTDEAGVHVPGLLDEPKNKDPRIQKQLDNQLLIEQQKVKNDLQLKELKYQEQSLLLDGKQAQQTKENNDATIDSLEQFRQANSRVQSDLLESQGRTADAEIKRIAEQYTDTLQQTLINTNPATEALVNVIEQIRSLGSVTTSEFNNVLSQAGIKFEDLSAETKALIALMGQLENQSKFKSFDTQFGLRTGNLDLQKTQIQDKINLGVISEANGRHQIAVAETAARVELERILALMSALPGLTDQEKAKLAEMRQQTSTLGRDFDLVGNEINSVISNDLGNFFNTLIDGTDDFGKALRGFFAGLFADISKAIFQAFILKAILGALGLSSQGTSGAGSAGGIGGFLSGLFGSPGKADGGPVSGPGTGTSDSILTRLSHGEWVIPAHRVSQYGRGMMAALTNGTFGAIRGLAAGGPVGREQNAVAGFTGVRNINVLDPELLSNYLNTPSGERTFLNIISRNPGKVRTALGI